jgi:hypothetical protein
MPYIITNAVKRPRIFLKDIQQLYATGAYSKSFKRKCINS